jgi:hypothetical protein
MTSSLGTLDVDALVDGTGPNDQWNWSHDGDTVVYEDHGVTGELQGLIQLFAPPRDQVLDGLYELVDYDGAAQLLRFGRDGSLVVCDARGAALHEQYAMNGFAFDWTREGGVVEKHAILYDPADASQIWLGSHQLVATRSALCQP